MRFVLIVLAVVDLFAQAGVEKRAPDAAKKAPLIQPTKDYSNDIDELKKAVEELKATDYRSELESIKSSIKQRFEKGEIEMRAVAAAERSADAAKWSTWLSVGSTLLLFVTVVFTFITMKATRKQASIASEAVDEARIANVQSKQVSEETVRSLRHELERESMPLLVPAMEGKFLKGISNLDQSIKIPLKNVGRGVALDLASSPEVVWLQRRNIDLFWLQLDPHDSVNATAVGPGEQCQIVLSLLRSTHEYPDNLLSQELLGFFTAVVRYFGFSLDWSVTYSDQIGMKWKTVYRLVLQERSETFMFWVQYVKTSRLEDEITK